jgi:hypothetical protein
MKITRRQLRQIIKEELPLISEVDKMAPPDGGGIGTQRQRTGRKMAGDWQQTPSRDLQSLTESETVILQIIDPSGALSWPDLGRASMDYVSSPSKKNKALLYLALVGVIPMTGSSASKGAKLVNFSHKMEKLSKLGRVKKIKDVLSAWRTIDSSFTKAADNIILRAGKHLNPEQARAIVTVAKWADKSGIDKVINKFLYYLGNIAEWQLSSLITRTTGI